jgi:hypothetical protein
MNKTRIITIERLVRIEVPAKDGKTEEKLVKKSFPCRVNAGVPFDHRMLK